MSFFFKLLLILLINKSLLSNQDNYVRIFEKTLLDYNIIFDKLGDHKAGALCIPNNNNKSYDKFAVGFSYDMYEKSYAIDVSLSGCREMKKKLISYDCKCEIIYR